MALIHHKMEPTFCFVALTVDCAFVCLAYFLHFAVAVAGGCMETPIEVSAAVANHDCYNLKVFFQVAQDASVYLLVYLRFGGLSPDSWFD